jgi:hypothetical protein
VKVVAFILLRLVILTRLLSDAVRRDPLVGAGWISAVAPVSSAAANAVQENLRREVNLREFPTAHQVDAI